MGKSAGAAAPEARRFSGDDLGRAVNWGTITGRFAACVRAAPSAVALIQDGDVVTYSELDRRSNQLARHLRDRGVGAGSVVALLAGRSVASLTGVVATLKAGAAYAPLDPVLPAAYLDWMVRDCGAGLVLCDAVRDREFPATTLSLEQALQTCASQSDSPLDDRSSPDDIAYVMYTSGSTGRPKGVQIPHRAVLRLVTDQTYARFAADEVFLHLAPLAFDASTFEIWGALLHGARAIIVDDDRPSLNRIAQTIRQHRVSTAWFTAGLFHLLVDHQLDALGGLRQILAGGDVLSPTHVQRALAGLSDCQLINGYGPTENTTFTCCYRIPRDGWGGGPVPIGVPIGGTYVRLLDDAMSPVSDGESGMLYAGGTGLARGYVGEARLAADSFVSDPWRAGALLYRTGDLARLRPDGALDFLGRRDRQVKIDGKRVELGEIEETLRRQPGVSDAVVMLRAGTDGQAPLLTAYVKPAPGLADRAALVAAAQRGLARALPAYMRPSRLVALEEFPLTANGKVDQARLPAPESAGSAPAPREEQPNERLLTDIFRRVLGRRDIALDGNFFDLGASSLKLLEAHAAIESLWPGVSVVDVFSYPTIRALAQRIDGRPAMAAGDARLRAERRAATLRRLRGRLAP